MDKDHKLYKIGLEQAKTTFVAEWINNTPEQEQVIAGVGIAISKMTHWDGLAILEIMYYALEDANFHTENQTVKKWIDSYK